MNFWWMKWQCKVWLSDPPKIITSFYGFLVNNNYNIFYVFIGVACDRYDIMRLLLDNGANMYANGGYECAISVYRNNGSIVELLLGIIYVFWLLCKTYIMLD